MLQPRSSPIRASQASPRVELGQLPGLIGYMLRRAQLVVSAHLVTALEELDLRPGTFSVLVVLEANPGLNQAGVCEALGIQRANLVPVTAELERRGFLVRMPSRAERRSHALRLTPDGQRMLKRAWTAVRAHEAQLAARLGTKGRRQLLAHLNALVNLAGEES